MALNNDEIEILYHLAHRKFKKIFGRHIIRDGYFNPERSFDESVIKMLMFYYRFFRRGIWKDN